MNSILLGIILGAIYGAVVVAPMTKMTFSDKQAAIAGAFINRFAIGFLIPNALVGINPLIRGLVLGIVLSLPDALITKSYKPIIGLGIVGGSIIGIITQLAGIS